MVILFDEFSSVILEVLGASMVLVVIFGIFVITVNPEEAGIFSIIASYIQSLVGG